MAFEIRLEAGCALGESPVWIAEEGRLLFVDITGRRLHWFDPASGAHAVREVEEDVGCVAPVRGGGVLAAMRSGVFLLDADGRRRERLAENPEPHVTSRFNDGKVDPRGRLLVGTIDEARGEGHPEGAGLYRLDRRGLVRLKSGLRTSNGLAFDASGRILHHSDTPRFTVWRHAYDPEAGTLLTEATFARLDPEAPDRARPDGAAFDVDGGYWSVLWDGGRVNRYGSAGELVEVLPLVARRPTMPAFGGPDLRTLFVTSAADGGAGGALFARASAVAGVPIPPFDPEA